MLRSMQAVAFSMKVEAEKLNVISNNIANMNTRGYRREAHVATSFEDVLISAVKAGERTRPVGDMVLGLETGGVYTVFEPGTLEQTGYETDLAIREKGFFAVDAGGERFYTRAGNFRLDDDDYLVTQEGYYVLGQNGRIRIPERVLEVKLDGVIKSYDEVIDTLEIVDFNDYNALERLPGGYFRTDEGNVTAPEKVSVLQKYLESSNVDMVVETRELLNARRNYESCQQIMIMLDNTLGKAVSEIGRL